jgi:hypothetical protein
MKMRKPKINLSEPEQADGRKTIALFPAITPM